MNHKIIIANWKMELNPKQSLSLASKIQKKFKTDTSKKLVLCPSFLALPYISKNFKLAHSYLGAQNCGYKDQGALTGEVSPKNLKKFKTKYVILGHSERRALGEDNETVNKKVEAAWKNKLIPVVCIGENLKQKRGKQTKKILKQQILESIPQVKKNKHIIVAYEPIWAIGTGKTVKTQEAKTVFQYLKEIIEENYNIKKFSFIYGGSVKPDNVDKFSRIEEIDGLLVGGSSLKVSSFYKIYKSF